MKAKFKTNGTCSTEIFLDVEDGVIKEVSFLNGCDGNLKAISALVKGMEAKEAAKRLKGISCGWKNTSCGDQLAQALEQIKDQ